MSWRFCNNLAWSRGWSHPGSSYARSPHSAAKQCCVRVCDEFCWRWRSKPQTLTIDGSELMAGHVLIDGVRTWYDEHGDGEPLVLLHPGGAGVDARAFSPNLDSL